MRQIKYKAWSKTEKKFIVDWERVLPTHYDYPVEKGGHEYPHMSIYVPDVMGESECDLLLSTGLKDKNGRMIYEGDIVKWEDGYEVGETTRIAKVFYENGCLCYWDCVSGKTFKQGAFIYANTKKHLEVVGNIYENPDLLENG